MHRAGVARGVLAEVGAEQRGVVAGFEDGTPMPRLEFALVP
jgi:hypothetical protein